MNIIIYRRDNSMLLRCLTLIQDKLASKQKYFIANFVNRDGFQVCSTDGKFTINVIGYSGVLNNMNGLTVDYFNSYDSEVSLYLKKRGGYELGFESSIINKICALMDKYNQRHALYQLKSKLNAIYGEQITINFDKGYENPYTVEYPQKTLKELKEISKIMNERTNRLDYNNLYSIGSLFGIRKPEINKVIFSGPCTIVLWDDGDKTMVRCENEHFDKEKGLAMAIAKKFLGTNKNKSDYFDIFKGFIPEEKEKTKTVTELYTVKEVAIKERVTSAEIRKRIKKGLYPGAYKENGIWLIPLE